MDFDHRIDALFFTSPISRGAYLFGRFLGALVFSTLVLTGLGIGMWLGTKMWFCDAARFGPNHAAFYLWPYAVQVVPNLLFAWARSSSRSPRSRAASRRCSTSAR